MTRPSGRQSTITKDSNPTVPITAFEDIFRALPEGALLGSETYYISSIRSEGASCNVYGVEEARPMFPCPNLECGYIDNPVDQRACTSCSTSLDGVVSIHRRHQLLEYRDYSDVSMIARVTELGLSHPGLLLYPYFVEQPYGNKDRYYLVLPDPMPMLASNVTLPQKTARVLDWGAQLAEALAYLHDYNLGWQKAGAAHIALRDRQAMWVDFNTIQPLSSERTEAVQQRAQDVAHLTGTMLYLATGKNTYQSQPNLPEAAVNVFERVLGTHEITSADNLAEAFREAVRRHCACA